MNKVGVFRRGPDFPEEPEALTHKPFEALATVVQLKSKKNEPTIIHMPRKIAMTHTAAKAVVEALVDGDV